MGSMQYIYSPENWKIILRSKSKISSDDYIYQVIIGWCDDEIAPGVICEFISKENYDNILKGNISVKSFPYNSQKIILFDKDDNIIPLLKFKSSEEHNNKVKKKLKK